MNSDKPFAVYLLLIICFLIYKPTLGQGPNKADAILGTYWTPDKDAKIQIYKNKGAYFGKTIWLTKKATDTFNPNPAQRGRNLMGIIFLENFKYENELWTGGIIYDPKTGNTYKSKMWLDHGNLKVRGYIGISLFGRSAVFERID